MAIDQHSLGTLGPRAIGGKRLNMEIGMVGLGKMGGNMCRRLHDRGHKVIGFDAVPAKIEEVSANLSEAASSLKELVQKLSPPRLVWTMVPAGKPTAEVIAELAGHLESGDILVDGGNSFYKDSQFHAAELAAKDIHFLDIGVSGGLWGLAEGYCLMAGGEKEALEHIQPIIDTLAADGGYARVGNSGAGHYTKMVHNGIEYAMLESYGEGFELLHSSEFELDLHQIASLWLHGSVVRSWLLNLTEQVFRKDSTLDKIKGYVEDSGEGRWSIDEAIEKGVPVPAIADALFARFKSQEQDSYAAKVIAALRHEFGGHKVLREETDVDIAA